MIKLWGRRNAYNVQKVSWALGELDLLYEHIEVGGGFGGLDQADFLAMNPNGRIPVLADDGFVIWESNSIVRYLCATYSQNHLWLESPAERSLADRWMDWELATFQDDFLDLFWGFYRTPEVLRNQQRIQQAAERCEKHLALLDAHLASQAFLAGDAFTMGDIPVATSLYRYFEMGVPTPEIPNVRRWYQALTKRKAYRENIMVPFNELYGRQTF
ncbi:glutathione S-transferase family protein [Methylomonas sp. MgM2]|jgi:glutathione S-transferase